MMRCLLFRVLFVLATLLLLRQAAFSAPAPITLFVPVLHICGRDTILALQPAAEVLGMSLRREGEKGLIFSREGQTIAEWTIGSKAAKHHDLAVTLSSAPFLQNNVVYGPFYEMIYLLDGTSTINPNRTVTVTLPGRETPLLFSFGIVDHGEAPLFEQYSEWHAFDPDQGLQRLTYSEEVVGFPDVSADGTRYVYEREYTIRIRPIDAPLERILLSSSWAADGSVDIYEHPYFTPDGKRVCFTCVHYENGQQTQTAGIINADGTEKRLFPGVERIEYLPGGKWILFRTRREFWLQTGLEQAPPERISYTDLLYTPDGNTLVYTQEGATPMTLHVRDLVKGTDRNLGAGKFPLLSPDGSLLIFSRTTVNPATHNLLRELVAYRLSGPDAGMEYTTGPDDDLFWDEWPGVFSPDGSKFCWVREATVDTFQLVIVKAADLSLLGKWPISTSTFPVYSPDGRKIIYAIDGTIYRSSEDGTDQQKLNGSPLSNEFKVLPDSRVWIRSRPAKAPAP